MHDVDMVYLTSGLTCNAHRMNAEEYDSGTSSAYHVEKTSLALALTLR